MYRLAGPAGRVRVPRRPRPRADGAAGSGITVSGNGCVALWARNNGSTDPQTSVSIGVTDRCAGGERDLYNTNQNYRAGRCVGALVRRAVRRVPRGTVLRRASSRPTTIVRIDTANRRTSRRCRITGFPYFGWDSTLGVDISDDGSVIVAVESGNASSAAVIDLARRRRLAGRRRTGERSSAATPSQAPGAGFPSISGDGRFVSFTSEQATAPAEPRASGRGCS